MLNVEFFAGISVIFYLCHYSTLIFSGVSVLSLYFILTATATNSQLLTAISLFLVRKKVKMNENN